MVVGLSMVVTRQDTLWTHLVGSWHGTLALALAEVRGDLSRGSRFIKPFFFFFFFLVEVGKHRANIGPKLWLGHSVFKPRVAFHILGVVQHFM